MTAPERTLHRQTGLPCLLLLAALLFGCAHPLAVEPPARRTPPSNAAPIATAAPRRVVPAAPLAQMGYTIQVGAFANLDNAVNLERRLDARGIDAYYFRHESGLYKVRFGNHASRQAARNEAGQLQAKGVIDEFYIVAPEEYAANRIRSGGQGDLRQELVRTARRFLGVPYRWGGTDREDGFDCSGLAMVCYRLNGLNLPRISLNQFQSGRPVPLEQMQPGDLVFFATNGGREVSHVGIFIGDGRFIHAPRSGQQVRVELLNESFYARTFIGARSYL